MSKATITVAEAAEMFGVAPITIRRYIAAGRLTAYRVGPRLIRLDHKQVARELMGHPRRSRRGVAPSLPGHGPPTDARTVRAGWRCPTGG